MTVPTICTKRLVLRQLEESDAVALHPVLSDAETLHWWWSAPHRTLAETQPYVARVADQGAGYSCRAITERGDAALGWVTLREKREGVAEIGYILNRNHWGKGYAREALAVVISHGFDAIGLRRIAADVDPDNAASIALLRSLGFKLDGHLRGEWETHIGVRDSVIFGLLAHEWVEPLDMIS